MSVQKKAAVSVSEMARMLGLSRARFYQLVGTAFPFPLYDVSTRRPFYDELLQEECLEARRTNRGAVDGKPILFYARRTPAVGKVQTRQNGSATPKPKTKHPHLLEGLKGLGLMATEAQVGAALQKLYPQGTDGLSDADILRSIFVDLMAGGPAK